MVREFQPKNIMISDFGVKKLLNRGMTYFNS